MSKGGSGWWGVDLDGTLAYYDKWRGPDHIGEPIPKMVERVKRWLKEGRKVKIFTARMHGHGVWKIAPGLAAAQEQLSDARLMHAASGATYLADEIAELEKQWKVDVVTPIEEWCLKHIGQKLEVTNVKDFGMIELWDDRCVQVEMNTGERVGRK